MRGAKGLLISITGSFDMTLYEVEEAASRVRREVDPDANPDINIIVGATFDHSIEGRLRVSVVATGINAGQQPYMTSEDGDAPQSNRLVDRIAAPQQRTATEREKQAPRGQPEGKPETWQSAGNVTIEPRSPKYMVNQPGGRGKAPAQQAPNFEPQPPTRPIRPPRRPLTGKDFPELAQHEAELRERQSLGFKRRGGLLDWVTGRSRNQKDTDSSTQFAPPLEINGQHGAGDDDMSDERHSNADRGAKDTAHGRNGDEPFEIPNFFKRPLN
jgi:cell division protein FtsZ